MTTKRKSDVVADMPLTEELFFKFIKTKFPYSVWPTSFNVHDDTDARLAASWLLKVLQELNAFLLEEGDVKKNLDITRVPTSKKYQGMDRKKQLDLQKELST
jgi:hypothetical protein